MPHVPEEGTEAAVETSSEERAADDKKGADLLLSLAETAMERADNEDENERFGSATHYPPITPSPSSLTILSSNGKNAVVRSSNKNRQLRHDGTIVMELHTETHQLNPSPIKISPAARSRISAAVRDLEDAEGDDVLSEDSNDRSEKRALRDASANQNNNKQPRLHESTSVDGKPIISPSSSNEGLKTDSKGDVPAVEKPYHYAYHSFNNQQHIPPPHHANPHFPPPPIMLGHQPPYGPVPPPYMYPPNPYHYPPTGPYYRGLMPPPPPPGPMYPPHPHHHHHHPPFPQQQQPVLPPTAESERREGGTSSSAWQSTTPTCPSTNRCVPRKSMYPPSNWEEQQAHSNSIRIPDFSRLVNFPDYLTRGRCTNENGGMKNCVMCGKLCLCSSTRSGDSVSGNTSNKKADNMHIIPRQNKGVCTECDVTVWMVLDDSTTTTHGGAGLEIKWCKGCKNFRPWPCFGDKVMATKCVRCRDRQKEKYAAQKQKQDWNSPSD